MNSLINKSKRQFFFILLFFAITSIISCQKEASFETSGSGGRSGGTAVFTLVPSGTNCSDAVASGNFEEGTLLTTDSKLTVTVNVKQAGSWTFSTATINGFTFAGAGNFTATGSQVITLYAAGTPAKAGDFSFKVNIGGANCSVSVSVIAKGSGGGGTGEYYYKATIGGINYYQSVTDNNNYEAGSGGGGLDDAAFGAGINYINPPAPAGLTEFGISKGIMHHYFTATQSEFKAFFAPGTYPYAPSGFPSGDGVGINWTDPTGAYWDTRDGAVDQVGSSFKIISTEDAYDALGRYYIKVKMQFNCKLYNATTGAVKELKNGEMVGAFGML